MKRLFGIFAVLLAGCATTAQADDDIVLNATVAITDGSSIKGELKTDEIEGKTVFDDDFEIDCALVKSLAFQGTNASAKVTLVNGDQLAMTVETKSFKLNSSLGELAIPRESIRSLSIAKRSTKCSTEGLIFYCSFDGTDAVQKPTVGPTAFYNNASFSDGKVGQALIAQRHKPQAAFNLPANFFGKAGCIEFWARILNPSTFVGCGGDPRLFVLSNSETGDFLCGVDIVSNNGGGNSGFSTWTITGNIASLAGMRNLTYQELLSDGNYRDWHHFAVVWDADGIKGLPVEALRTAALLVDGKLTPCAKFDARNPTDIERLVAIPMRLSFTYDPDMDREHQTKSTFLIDEFKIWNHAKTEFDL
jgi:hypothetical protein